MNVCWSATAESSSIKVSRSSMLFDLDDGMQRVACLSSCYSVDLVTMSSDIQSVQRLRLSSECGIIGEVVNNGQHFKQHLLPLVLNCLGFFEAEHPRSRAWHHVHNGQKSLVPRLLWGPL